jgi:DNA (cytosine-5)-methyltransferase 1
MKVASLFSGIGGFEIGFGRSGHEVVLTCENWPPARAVLAAHFGSRGIPNHPDITELPDLPADVDVICAGFPCQDLSQAGRTAGIEGLRSSLVRHVFRLLDRRPVPWVLLENVSFMLSLGRGKALDAITHELEERGYRWAYRVVNSLGWLPQRRERVFLLASREGDPADVLYGDEATPALKPTSLDEYGHGFYWTEGIRGLGWAPDAIPTLKNGSTLGIPSPPAILRPIGDIITPDLRDAERLQGFPADWTAPAAAVARNSVRWALVGNAVTTPVAAWLGSRLGDPGVYDPQRNRPLRLTPGRWPRAARFDGRVRYAVEINEYPIWRARLPLLEFLEHPGKPLSERATAGFLRRAETSSLTLVTPEFKARVRRHLMTVRGAASDLIAAE